MMIKNINRLWIENDLLCIEDSNARVYKQSLKYYPRLRAGLPEEQAQWTQNALGIRWEMLDEDISFESFFYQD